MTDLLDLTPKSDTIEVTIVHPSTKEPLKNSDGTVMTITVYAPYSKEYKKVVHDIANKRLKKAQEKKGSSEFTSEDIERLTLESIARSTKEWNITFGGEMPKLTIEKAIEVYDKVFWIRPQLEIAIEESMDFMKA